MRAFALSVVFTATVAAQATYVPERVFDTAHREFTDFEMMLADVGKADVIFVGEQHDDPNTHRLESALLQGLVRRNVPVTVSLEMFERDVQPALDAYQLIVGRMLKMNSSPAFDSEPILKGLLERYTEEIAVP